MRGQAKSHRQLNSIALSQSAMKSPLDLSRRLHRLRLAMQDAKLDALLISTRPNCLYLSHLPSSHSLILVLQDKAFFFTDFRYIEIAERSLSHLTVVRISQNGMSEIGEIIQRHRIHRLGFEGRWEFQSVQKLQACLNSTCELVESGRLLRRLRAVKDLQEIRAIEQAQRINERILRSAVRHIERGITEQALQRYIRTQMIALGVEEAFETIVAFGPTSSLPHARPGRRRIENSGLVLIDMGVKKAFYHSDMTRTLGWRIVTPEIRNIYEIVLEAQSAAFEKIRPGISAREVDAAARQIIAAHGYGECFGHGLGHGVGLEIHEAPTLNPNSEDVLEERMVVTVEPGIYLPGKGGVRIEDLVIVTKNGPRNLTRFPKSFVTLS
ncbi:MAG: aminopeptidase P family protein [Candidatus Hydrogenedentota bacterium]|nr:MAG: aminopeptidase P family protein [Candidatus Hydrogenedentota bacterium]GIX44589.1 MAG: peptidase M24 [Candidatus Sumerlaea sp.]